MRKVREDVDGIGYKEEDRVRVYRGHGVDDGAEDVEVAVEEGEAGFS